jgi:hypothetical protein
VEKALDTRSSRAISGNLDEHLKYQAAQSLEKGGSMGEMAGMGMGMAMGQQMAQAMAAGMGSGGSPSAAGTTPPPPPPAVQWYVAENGQSRGPFSEEQLRQMAARGELGRESYLWREGFDGWKSAGEALPELFGSTPPPPPPPPAG